CAQGQFRRNLRSAGFSTERLPGPPGKREMTRAIKI
ncbi:MAG: MnmC family methyltransferase, partial [Bacteroidota bacterium]